MDRREWLGRVARGGLDGGGALALSAAFAGGAAAGEAFANDALDAALERLGAAAAVADPRLRLDVAAEAWNGDFVMVRVDASALDGVRELHLLRDAHVPASIVRLETDGAFPAGLTLPIRLERPCRVHALARTSRANAARVWVRAESAVREVGAPGCG